MRALPRLKPGLKPRLKTGAVWAVSVGALAGLSACSAMIGVHITGGLEQPVARFGSDPAKPEKACLRSLTVHEANGAGRSVVWAIEARGGRCIGLRQVVYGEAPNGFDTRTAATALKPDTAYSVVGQGVTGGTLSRVPWMGGAEVVFEDGGWRSITPQEQARRRAQQTSPVS